MILNPSISSRLKIKNTFVSHVEKQVENAQIGLKSPLLLIHLIIGLGGECLIGDGVFGADGCAEIWDDAGWG
jgi:hypothetical protein